MKSKPPRNYVRKCRQFAPSEIVIFRDEGEKLHPSVRATRFQLTARGGHRNRALFNDPGFNVKVSPGLVPRAIRILDSVVRACVNRGYAFIRPTDDPRRAKSLNRYVDEGNHYLHVVVGSQEVYFTLRELGRKIPGIREPEPKGLLEFKIHTWGAGRTCWTEKADGLFDVVDLTEIVAQIAKVADNKQNRMEERQREEARRLASERMTRDLVAQREKERRATAEVFRDLRQIERARQLRAYIEHMETRRADSSAGIDARRAAWLSWARSVVATIDPLLRNTPPWNMPAFRDMWSDHGGG